MTKPADTTTAPQARVVLHSRVTETFGPAPAPKPKPRSSKGTFVAGPSPAASTLQDEPQKAKSTLRKLPILVDKGVCTLVLLIVVAVVGFVGYHASIWIIGSKTQMVSAIQGIPQAITAAGDQNQAAIQNGFASLGDRVGNQMNQITTAIHEEGDRGREASQSDRAENRKMIERLAVAVESRPVPLPPPAAQPEPVRQVVVEHAVSTSNGELEPLPEGGRFQPSSELVGNHRFVDYGPDIMSPTIKHGNTDKGKITLMWTGHLKARLFGRTPMTGLGHTGDWDQLVDIVPENPPRVDANGTKYYSEVYDIHDATGVKVWSTNGHVIVLTR